ncbi:MAG: helix-turn-helix domain-containing protein [Streptosporangiaceae bacterium]
MSESDAVRALRRTLGGRLATARKQAHYTQREFARRISFSRSTLSTVESGVQRAGRGFWAACDGALGTGEEFQLGYDRIQAQLASDRQNAQSLRPSPSQQAVGLRAATLAEALRAYRALGWPVVTDAAAELETGTVLDALMVPRTAGLLAASWWQSTGGAADEIRGLPALPDPRQALAVIVCGERSFFLAAAGSFPWDGQDLTELVTRPDGPVIGWYSSGGRIPAPPSTRPDGQQAVWAFLPPGRIQLAASVMLIDLLAKAVTTTWRDPRTLRLADGVEVIPAGRGV